MEIRQKKAKKRRSTLLCNDAALSSKRAFLSVGAASPSPRPLLYASPQPRSSRAQIQVQAQEEPSFSSLRPSKWGHSPGDLGSAPAQR